MTFGITAVGFVIKRLADCRAELDAAYRLAFGTGIKTTPDTVFGKMIDIHSDREAQLWELAEAIYNSQYPNSASGQALANIGQYTNIAPNPATRSLVTAYLAGTNGVVVPAGSRIAVIGSGDQFSLTASVVLSGNQISISGITRAGSVATATSVAHGRPVLSWVFIGGANQAEYNGLVQVATVPTANTFTYAVTGTPATPATGVIVGDPATAASMQAVHTGPIQALDGTLTQIVNPVIGWTRAENALDATLGLSAETDANFRVRRLESIAGLGAARQAAIRSALLGLTGVTKSIVFVNDLDTADGAGRPPHSIECLLVGGTDQTIRDMIWAKKAAGIQTYGTVSGTVVDSQGGSQTVYFSRSTGVNIFLILDIVKDAALFPANGSTLLLNEILAFGAALNIGDDVIPHPALEAVIAKVPGITDVVIKIGTAPAPTLDNNIVITATQLALFDSSRITINVT